VCCSVLQCVAVCCSVLQCGAACCSACIHHQPSVLTTQFAYLRGTALWYVTSLDDSFVCVTWHIICSDVCENVCIAPHVYTCVYVCVFMCVCFVCECVNASVYICVCVRVRALVCVCVWIYTYTQKHAATHTLSVRSCVPGTHYNMLQHTTTTLQHANTL